MVGALDYILGQNLTNVRRFRASFAGQEMTKLYYLMEAMNHPEA
jgi:hypothetical protein